MYRKILVAIDGSDSAMLALKQAITMCLGHDAQLIILHVIDYAGISGGFKSLRNLEINEAVLDEARALLAKAKQQASKQGIRCKTSLIELNDYKHHIAEKILAETKICKAQLLVIGTQGLRGLARMILGSVADYAVRYSDIPVLIVPHKQKPK